MSRFVFKMPDLGEGTVSAEIVAWRVQPGDQVEEGQTIAEVATDKAIVELPSPVRGRVASINGNAGDAIAVGADLITFDSEASEAPAQKEGAEAEPVTAAAVVAQASESAGARVCETRSRVMASPATRRRAREAGIDLSTIRGTGPGGRIMREDLDAVLAGRKSAPARTEPAPATARKPEVTPESAVEEIKVLGVRRVIAQRMVEAARTIPHFSYVEEVDVTELEALRQYLSARAVEQGGARLTLLPLIVSALARVLRDFPQCNAHYDAQREVIIRHRAVHVGIATQTRDGLKVPVVRHVESLGLHALAAEIRRVADAARNNRITRDELTGSTITVTSLGKLGGIVTTPIINPPEVAIIGVNRMIERPVVRQGAVVVRQMMNLSSSFDHRFVDGHDAAAMVQALKERLEHPATIWMDDARS